MDQGEPTNEGHVAGSGRRSYVTLDRLVVQVPPETKTLRPENREFLAGKRPNPKFDSMWGGQNILGLLMMAAAALGAIAVLVSMGTDLMFNSPLSTSVEARFGAYEGDLATYSYDVGDQTYSGGDEWTTRSSSPGPTIDVTYLRLQPSKSQLESNLDSSLWIVAIFLWSVLAIIGFIGWYTRRYLARMTAILKKATHIIPATVTGSEAMAGKKGTVYTLQAVSPTSSQPIVRHAMIGRLNSRRDAFGEGDEVAMIYASDNLCEVL